MNHHKVQKAKDSYNRLILNYNVMKKLPLINSDIESDIIKRDQLRMLVNFIEEIIQIPQTRFHP